MSDNMLLASDAVSPAAWYHCPCHGKCVPLNSSKCQMLSNANNQSYWWLTLCIVSGFSKQSLTTVWIWKPHLHLCHLFWDAALSRHRLEGKLMLSAMSERLILHCPCKCQLEARLKGWQSCKPTSASCYNTPHKTSAYFPIVHLGYMGFLQGMKWTGKVSQS